MKLIPSSWTKAFLSFGWYFLVFDILQKLLIIATTSALTKYALLIVNQMDAGGCSDG